MENEALVGLEAENIINFSAEAQRKKLGFDAAIQKEIKPENVTNIESYRNQTLEDKKAKEEKEVESNILEFPSEKRVWVYRGLEWGHFQRSDVVKNRPWIERVLAVVDTAVHEMGHVYMIKRGGTFLSATVIPDGNTLGVTKGVPDSTEDWMRSCAGGLAAEVADGQFDHSGTGSDMGQLENTALFSPTLSASEAKSQANSTIFPQIDSLRRDALSLAMEGTIAA